MMDVTGSRARFIWCRGVLAWGLTTGVLYAAVMAFLWPCAGGYLRSLLVWLCFLPLWAGGGYIWGLVMWKRVIIRQQQTGGAGR
jgi:hypothetical protein